MSDKLTIYFFSSTHWDREWYESFQGFRFRLVDVMNEIIDVLENNEQFPVFHMDGQTIVLDDFLQIEPQQKGRLQQLIQNKKLIIGPWYVMPDEYLVSGESLIRNLMKGFRICNDWGVDPWKYGYICDIFGHIAQMPQIFNGFDIDYAMLGRGTNEHTTPAHFRWQSPDGSECTTFKLPDSQGYGAFYNLVIKRVEEEQLDGEATNDLLRKYIDDEAARSPVPVVIIMDGMDHEKIHPETPNYIKRIQALYPNAEVKHVNLLESGKELDTYRELMPIREGELNETAKVEASYLHLITHILSSRYPLKQANDQCQVLLEKWAEPLLAVASLHGLKMQPTYVEKAYEYLLQNHPHDSICGCSIDQVHKDMEYRFDQSKEISQLLISSALKTISPDTTEDLDSHKRLLTLTNPLPFPRKEVITIGLDLNLDYPFVYQEPFGYEKKNSFKIFDCQDKEIPYSLISIKRNWKAREQHKQVDQVDRHTIALEVEVPALGTAQYAVVPFEGASRYLDVMPASDHEAENEFIRLRIRENGTLCIEEKESGRIYDQLGSYLDDGEIGDGWYHVNPTVDRLVSSNGSACEIERLENSIVRTVFQVRHELTVPKEMEYDNHGISRSKEGTYLEIVSKIELAKSAKHVFIETEIVNRAQDHRLRLSLPTQINTEKYFVNQAFTFIDRKTGIDPTTQAWKECEVPESQMSGIVGKRREDGSGLAFVSAYGLHECAALDDARGTINVTLYRSFGRTVLTNGEAGGQLLGTMSFRYAIALVEPSTTSADLVRLQERLQVGIHSETIRVSEKERPVEPISFMSLSESDICMSILKRPEQSELNQIVVRFYNLSSNHSDAVFRCYRQIMKVSEVNLNEEVSSTHDHQGKKLDISLAPWKIRTYCLQLGNGGSI